MKLIKKTKTSICCGQTPKGRTKWQEVTESQEANFKDILIFRCDKYGNKLQGIEDRISLLQDLVEKIILDRPEIFKDYLESCAEYASDYGKQFEIKD